MTPMPESSAADRDTIRSPAFVLRRYVLAIALFAAAFAATVAFREFLRPQIFYFFVLAVALSAWLSGLGPALFVGVLSVLAADFLFIEPVGHIGSDAPRGLISLALFLDHLYEGKELNREYPDAKIRIEPAKAGKKTVER